MIASAIASRTRLYYFFRAIEAASTLACLPHPWKREKSPAFQVNEPVGRTRLWKEPRATKDGK
jgi:hypothetical protein